MFSISKTQNTNLKTAKYTSFAKRHIYLCGFFNDKSIQIPSSLKKFMDCFNALVNNSSCFSVAFDANKNTLFVERTRAYSAQGDLMQFDLTTLEEDKLGYTISVTGANWTNTVKTLNKYLGKEYAKMSPDKSTLIIENTNHTELKAVLQTVSRINAKVNKCVHNGLGRNVQYETAMSRCRYLNQYDNPDMQQFFEHSKAEMMKYVKNTLKKTKFIDGDIDKCAFAIYDTACRYLNYFDEQNFELVHCGRITITNEKTNGYAAPVAYLRVIYKVVNGKASWKLIDDASYTETWQNDRKALVNDDFEINIYNRINRNSEACTGYTAYLVSSLERIKKYDTLVDAVKKVLKV